jgi:hypothetical protein
MVKIIDYRARLDKEGNEFFVLIIEGGLEPVKSKQTGRYYFTSKKASVTTTFDALTCQELVGQRIPGSVQKVECEPFEFILKETGEVISLSHRWVYLREGESVTEKVLAESEIAMPI